MLKEFGIPDDKFLAAMQQGLANPSHKKIFEQLIIVDKYEVFKRMMLKRNKELELEALNEIQDQDRRENRHVDQSTNLKEIQRLNKEREQAELELAIAESLAIEKERQKILEREEYELQEALRQSMLEYEQEQLRHQKSKGDDSPIFKPPQEEEKVSVDQSQDLSQSQLSDSQSKTRGEGKKNFIIKTSKKDKLRQAVMKERENEASLRQSTSVLPPINSTRTYEEIFDPSREQKKKENVQETASTEIKKVPSDTEKEKELMGVESLAERRKRLRAQRDLIVAKKNAEREAEMLMYDQQRAKNQPQEQAPKVRDN